MWIPLNKEVVGLSETLKFLPIHTTAHEKKAMFSYTEREEFMSAINRFCMSVRFGKQKLVCSDDVTAVKVGGA
jgi:hypothetical protein